MRELKDSNGRSERKMPDTRIVNTVNPHEDRYPSGLTGITSFDDSVNRDAGIENLRITLIREYLHEVGSSLLDNFWSRSLEDIAREMKLVKGCGQIGKLRPVNVGLMFFNDAPDDFFPYTRIEVVNKPDPTGLGMTERIFGGLSIDSFVMLSLT